MQVQEQNASIETLRAESMHASELRRQLDDVKAELQRARTVHERDLRDKQAEITQLLLAVKAASQNVRDCYSQRP